VAIDAVGVPVVRRQLLRMADNAADCSPVMDAIGDEMLEANARRFDNEGDGEWTKPSDDWTDYKAAHSLDVRAEHASLDLRKSLTERGGENVLYVRPDGLVLDSTAKAAPYAKKRQGDALLAYTEGEKRQWVRQVQAFVMAERRDPGRGLLARSA
jgi:hypothetical protein